MAQNTRPKTQSLKLLQFTGATTGNVAVEKVCEAAKECDEVLIIGSCGDDAYYASSYGEVADLLLAIELFKQHLLAQVH